MYNRPDKVDPDISLEEIVMNGIVVDINNVARWVVDSIAEDKNRVNQWISCILPPFETALFKFHMYQNKLWKDVGNHSKDSTTASYVGIATRVLLLDKKGKQYLNRNNFETDNDARYMFQAEFVISMREDLNNSIKPGGAVIFLDSGGFQVGDAKYYIDEAYKKFFINDTLRSNPDIDTSNMEKVEEGIELVIADRMMTYIEIAMVAISLFHCKNIELVDKPVTRAQRRRVQRTGVPLVVEKVLVIEPFKRKMRYENVGALSDLHKAMHLCRGHFREYTEENPLFGKHIGRYWIPPHIRGTKAIGEIKKGYKIETEDNKSN